MNYTARCQAACELMAERGIDALVLTKPANLKYLTGDGRPCTLTLLTQAGNLVITVPQTDVADVRQTVPIADVRGFGDEEEMLHGFGDILDEFSVHDKTLAMEKNFWDASLFGIFVDHVLPNATVVPVTPVLSPLRMIKSAEEIELLQVSADIAEAGMEAAAGAIAVGAREIAVAAEAEYAMRRCGAEGFGSYTYVASGLRSTIAHGPPTDREMAEGEMVQVHLAPLYGGYCVDLCRTFAVGEPSDEQRRALHAYRAAQEAGIAAACPGAHLMGVDESMSVSLQGSGYSGRFLRPTFHGIGIEHEEAPIPGGHALVHGELEVKTIEAGMTLAIGNCGLYLDGFGVRMEDSIWVSPGGPIALTRYPKEL